MNNLKMYMYLILSISFIILGIKYFFVEVGVNPENVYKKTTKIAYYDCTDYIRTSDSLVIRFADIDKKIRIKILIHCNNLDLLLNKGKEVEVWLEDSQFKDSLDLWGLAFDGEKVIWPQRGMQLATSFNAYVIMFFLLSISFGKKFLKLFETKKKKFFS